MSDLPPAPPFALTVGPPDAPDMDPELGGLEDDAQAEHDAGALAVTEDQVRRVLVTIGTSANQWAADEDVPDQWVFTPAELDALAPALTTYVNRSARLRAAVERSDQLTIAAVLAGYGWRNVADGQKAHRARQYDGQEVTTADGFDSQAPMDQGPARPAAAGVDLFGGAPAATGPGSFAPDRPADGHL